MAFRIKSIINPWKLSPIINKRLIINNRSIHSTNLIKQSSETTTKPTCSTSTSSNICPACSSPLPFQTVPICPTCSNLLPPPSPHVSHFSLFNLSPTAFDIDLKGLKTKFRDYQQQVHPDLFSNQGEQKETWARDWSSRVNNGWKVLEGVRSRGEYLLEQNGITVGEGESLDDPELLMIVMETREALEEAQSQSEVDEIRRINKETIEDTVTSLSRAFGKDPPDLEKAKGLVIKLRYLNNVDKVCREWVQGKRVEIQY